MRVNATLAKASTARPRMLLAALAVLSLSGCGPQAPTSTEEQAMFVVDPDGRGPLTLEELKVSFENEVGRELSEQEKRCVLREVGERAFSAGDPETLDPATVEFIPVDQWSGLDAHGKRVILAQVIVTKAFFVC